MESTDDGLIFIGKDVTTILPPVESDSGIIARVSIGAVILVFLVAAGILYLVYKKRCTQGRGNNGANEDVELQVPFEGNNEGPANNGADEDVERGNLAAADAI